MGTHHLLLRMAALVAATGCLPPSLGARLILHPPRQHAGLITDVAHQDLVLQSGDATLKGWLFPAHGQRRGLVLYLHGRGDNRRGAVLLAQHLNPSGYDVLAYDSRAQGESGGRYSTFGALERFDVARALDAAGVEHAVLVGVSFGGAVALQAAASDARVCGVFAQAPYAGAEQAIRRAGAVFADVSVDGAIAEAERLSGVDLKSLSTVRAAAAVHVPVLLVHGSEDETIPLDDSLEIFDALAGLKERRVLPGFGHNGLFHRDDVWTLLEQWLGTLTCPPSHPKVPPVDG